MTKIFSELTKGDFVYRISINDSGPRSFYEIYSVKSPMIYKNQFYGLLELECYQQVVKTRLHKNNLESKAYIGNNKRSLWATDLSEAILLLIDKHVITINTALELYETWIHTN